MEKKAVKKIKIVLIGILYCLSLVSGEEYTDEQKQEIGQKALQEMVAKIYYEAMAAKRAYHSGQFRDEILSNFATTAPRSEFIVNADISSDLQSGTESATVYVSTDGQSTWQSASANLIGTQGYENTWGGTISTGSGNSAFSYLSGKVNSSALGYDYGIIIVSSTPHNLNGNWPPASNLYADMVEEPSGDAPSNQDIIRMRATYKGNLTTDANGEEYYDIERVYANLTINGGCCDTGSLFGPWYLYGIGIVNPESEEAIAYAIGYGDGGFGQLSPGLLKISGDLSTGEVGGFEYLTTNITYSTSGNDMQATALMNYITDDSQWGVWPNSFNGFIVLGVTVEASLDGLDVAANVVDETNPGLLVANTTYQEGNNLLSLSNPLYDEETQTLSVSYSDSEGNLPWLKTVKLDNNGDMIYELDMVPNSHTYEDGVIYSVTLEDVSDGDYNALFHFADDDLENYPNPQLTLPITIGDSCPVVGDLNGDSTPNILDVVLLVNLVLTSSSTDSCSDINGDGILNVLDIVLLVNIVLG